MKRFITALVVGAIAAIWALYLVLVQVQKDLTWEVLVRPSWIWLLGVLAIALFILAVLTFPRSSRESVASRASVEPSPTSRTASSVRAVAPGSTTHGRLRADLQIGRPRRHTVTWKETSAPAGTLRAASGGLWEVVDEHGSTLGLSDSVTMGLAMIDLAAMGWRLEAQERTGPAKRPETTLADPSRATLGRRPELLGVEFLRPDVRGPYGGQRYRTEAWELANGDRVVIVSDNGGTSLMNNSENIARAVDTRWANPGRSPIIVEEWDPPTIVGHRFVVSDRAGGHRPVDFDELDASGLVLPRAGSC